MFRPLSCKNDKNLSAKSQGNILLTPLVNIPLIIDNLVTFPFCFWSYHKHPTMTKLYTVALLSLFFLSACKSASKAYEQGNYEDAIERAVKKLQKDPNDAPTIALLKQAYKDAVEQREESIRNLSNSNSDLRWEQMYQQYMHLQSLYQMVRQYPSAAKAVQPTDYASYVHTYRDKAAETYYQRGLKWMEEDTKNSYKEAYHEFQKALRFKPEDVETKRQMQKAYDAAVVKVVVLPLDSYNGSYYYSNSSYQMRNFQNRIMRQLNNYSGNDFIKFYTEWDARGNNLEPDEVLEMRLGRMIIGQPFDRSSNRRVSKEVVVKETVYKKDSVVKEYARVNATITTTQRTLVSEASMLLTAREPNGRILWSDEVSAEQRWQVEFATYTGDERALSEKDKELLNSRNDRRQPRAEDIADDLLRRLENNLSHRLRNYYNRYQ